MSAEMETKRQHTNVTATSAWGSSGERYGKSNGANNGATGTSVARIESCTRRTITVLNHPSDSEEFQVSSR